MEFPKPQDEHRFLEKLLGTWVVTESTGHEGYDPNDPAMRWTEEVRSIGGLWYLCEGRGAMSDGTPSAMVMTLGYDPAAGHYVGSWIGSMMTTMWVYKGWVERDGLTLTLEAEGPAFDDPKRTDLYRDVITFIDADHRRLTGSVRQPDGTFKTFMRSEFKRA